MMNSTASLVMDWLMVGIVAAMLLASVVLLGGLLISMLKDLFKD